MYAIFKKTIYDFRWTFFWYLIIGAGYVSMIVSFYPTVRESAQQFSALIDAYPEAIRDAFGISLDSFATLAGFLYMEFFSFMYIIVLAVLAFSLGAAMVSGEVDRGTAEFTFSFPLKRSLVLAGKFLASFAILLGVILATLLAVGIGGHLVHDPVPFAGLSAFFVILASVAFLLLSVATLLSSLLSGRAAVYGLSGGFLVLSYALHVLNGLNDKVAGIYAFSFFKYYGNAEQILSNGNLNGGNLAALLIAGAGILTIAFLVAGERDL